MCRENYGDPFGVVYRIYDVPAKMNMTNYEYYENYEYDSQACFIRRISVASNAIQTIDNEMIHLIIYCLNCIRCD